MYHTISVLMNKSIIMLQKVTKYYISKHSEAYHQISLSVQLTSLCVHGSTREHALFISGNSISLLIRWRYVVAVRYIPAFLACPFFNKIFSVWIFGVAEPPIRSY